MCVPRVSLSTFFFIHSLYPYYVWIEDDLPRMMLSMVAKFFPSCEMWAGQSASWQTRHIFSKCLWPHGIKHKK